MRINYFKVIPRVIIELIKLLPIITKYGKMIYEEVRNMYDKEYLTKLDDEIKNSLEIEE